ncbi:MAG: branched-chain amino acid transporter permease [Cypionkella sp.]|uniref:branched-chain amino acid ABC transporter permease n=1 Tax=Cypionkella sp. TaxID=2811411 RepID=UPI0026245038|nr:branched-chain amino acid ABC transporter permease [Cypionkella sp.]MDB5658885.1 branched-chain amino acid transporter permease [Cypionkella sp.]MDB5665748.1 branched-chain amino acid transporter permease [Cypionkella sp.]
MNLQFIVDGLISGSLIGLGAIGITLTYSILRFSNFAHGDFMAWGAYGTLSVVAAIGALVGTTAPIGALSFGWPLILAAIAGMIMTACLALLLDWLLFARLRDKGQSIIVVMASFGASMALRSLLEFIFTSSPTYFSRGIQMAIPIGLGIRITPDQMVMLATTIVLVTAMHLFMSRSQTGREMRAYSQNPALARVVGINVDRVVRATWIIGAALACAAGVMVGILVQIRPLMGLDLLLPMFAAAILGGIGSVPGAVLGGLIIGLSEAAAVQLIGAEWRAAIAFAILMAVLLVRPMGLFGRAER